MNIEHIWWMVLLHCPHHRFTPRLTTNLCQKHHQYFHLMNSRAQLLWAFFSLWTFAIQTYKQLRCIAVLFAHSLPVIRWMQILFLNSVKYECKNSVEKRLLFGISMMQRITIPLLHWCFFVPEAEFFLPSFLLIKNRIYFHSICSFEIFTFYRCWISHNEFSNTSNLLREVNVKMLPHWTYWQILFN